MATGGLVATRLMTGKSKLGKEDLMAEGGRGSAGLEKALLTHNTNSRQLHWSGRKMLFCIFILKRICLDFYCTLRCLCLCLWWHIGSAIDLHSPLALLSAGTTKSSGNFSPWQADFCDTGKIAVPPLRTYGTIFYTQATSNSYH